MSHQGLVRCLIIPRHSDAQLEAYLLLDLWRQERVDTTLNRGEIQYHEAMVMIEGKEVEQEWLTITGATADVLTDGQEIIFYLI